MLILLFLNQSICCAYSKEPSQCNVSLEHTKHVKTDGSEFIYNFTLKNFACTASSFFFFRGGEGGDDQQANIGPPANADFVAL